MNRASVIHFYLLVFCFFLVSTGVFSIPLNYGSKNVFGNYSSEKLITFMQTFGYLQEPQSGNEGLQVEFLYAENAITDGIREIQKFGGLQETGVLDEETIKLFSAPRCGVKDVLNSKERRKRYIIGSKNWKKRQITYFIANHSPKVDRNQMDSWVRQAFEAWALYSRLKFKQVYDSSADIIIAFGSYYHGDRYPFDGPGNILAHAFYPYEENAFGGDIHFDNDEDWRENATTLNEGVDFLTVMTHELGHSLGLAHSPVYTSLMFPYYKGVAPAQLDYDDILAMYSMYIMRPLEENADGYELTDNPESTDYVTPATTNSPAETTRIASFEEEITEPVKVPDLCEGNFDAVAYLHNSVLIFKESFVWKLNKDFQLEEDSPAKISKVFPNFPRRFEKIDAAYQVPFEDEIVFFSKGEYITYDPRGPIYTAYNITRYTYDPDVKKIDGAMVWAKNNRTYLFWSDRFWKYSDRHQMDQFYPRLMNRWNGIPGNIDDVVSIPGKQTIFFKESDYWVYDDKNVRPKEGYPKNINTLIDICME